MRAARATIRFSRAGRQADFTEATLNFVELVPLERAGASRVPTTTLPARALAECKGLARVCAQRWSIETAFETMRAWGLERFMVRSWRAIDRLLWIVALASALVVLALHDRRLARLRDQAVALARRLTVLGRRLTPGKLADAIGLDEEAHCRAWTAVWLNGELLELERRAFERWHHPAGASQGRAGRPAGCGREADLPSDVAWSEAGVTVRPAAT